MVTLTNLPANYDVALYNSSGVQIGISENAGTANELIIYNTTVLGTYYVKVYGNSGAYDPDLCYSLKATISSAGFKSGGIEEDTDPLPAELSVYPNPATSELNIDFISSVNERSLLRLYTISGQIILTREIDLFEGDNHYRMDISSVPRGMYFIELITNDQRIFKKVVIS